MANSYFSDQTLDDVMRSVIKEIEAHGHQINPTKGAATELTGVLLEVSEPRARLSRTETRGRLFSCLGELCWYLAKTNELGFISYYLAEYKKYADNNVIYGGYGPRLFDRRGIDQFTNVTSLLKRRPASRQAVIQLFDANDLLEEHKDIPCTCTLQFMIRHDKLYMFTNMRSNDVFSGLPHDVFSFTMLQEIMARALSVELGNYKHAVGSLHLYEKDRDAAQQFLDEGWQSTKTPMPPMPKGDPWPAIDSLRKAECVIRMGEATGVDGLEVVDPYWADLIRLLRVFRCWKDEDAGSIRELRQRMSADVYLPFIDKKLNQLP